MTNLGAFRSLLTAVPLALLIWAIVVMAFVL